MADNPSAFGLFYTLKYFLDFTNFIRFDIANFSQAINKPFATLASSKVNTTLCSVCAQISENENFAEYRTNSWDLNKKVHEQSTTLAVPQQVMGQRAIAHPI